MEGPRNGCLEHKHHNTAQEGIRFRIVSADNSRLLACRRTTLRIQRLLVAAIEEPSLVAEGQSVSGDGWRRSAPITHARKHKLPAFYLVRLLVRPGGTKFHPFPDESLPDL